MNLLLAGVSHKTAPLEVREQFAISDGKMAAAVESLRAESGIEEALILSTCNRVEFVLRVREGSDGLEVLRRFVKRFFGIRYDDFQHCFYLHRDYEAVRHLCRVAAGLDSMVLGEPQVLGQVKKAYALAREAKGTGAVLDVLFPQIFGVAKRVRTETCVAEAPVSVSSAAVELAQQVFGDLRGKKVMIIGAGQMGELAARHLVSKGAAPVLVSSRTYEHAVALASELRGLAIPISEIWQAMAHADIVISCTGCPHYIIRRADMVDLMGRRAHRPVFLVDIAVPRDIDPAVVDVPGCTLADIDGLKEVARRNLHRRERALEAADRIVDEEVEQFRDRRETLRVVPTIVSLRQRVEEIRRSELERTRSLFGELTPEQEEILEILTQGLVNKILHMPFTELKQAAARPDRSRILDLVRSIFHLEGEPTGTALAAN